MATPETVLRGLNTLHGQSLSVSPVLFFPPLPNSFVVSPSETLAARMAEAEILSAVPLTERIPEEDETYKKCKIYKLQECGGYRFLLRRDYPETPPAWKIHVSLAYEKENLEKAKRAILGVCMRYNVPVAKIAAPDPSSPVTTKKTEELIAMHRIADDGPYKGYQVAKGAVIYCNNPCFEPINWSAFLQDLVAALLKEGVKKAENKPEDVESGKPLYPAPYYRLILKGKDGTERCSVSTDTEEDAIPGSAGFLYCAKNNCPPANLAEEGGWKHFQEFINQIATPVARRPDGGAAAACSPNV